MKPNYKQRHERKGKRKKKKGGDVECVLTCKYDAILSCPPSVMKGNDIPRRRFLLAIHSLKCPGSDGSEREAVSK